MVKITWISAGVFYYAFSKIYILTKLRANDVKFISVDRQKLDLSIYIYTYGTVNSIFVEIQLDSTNIKNDPRKTKCLVSRGCFLTYAMYHHRETNE